MDRLARRTTLISASGTTAMRTAANELKARGLSVINFAAGELDFPSSDVVKSAAIAAIEADEDKYLPTLGLPALREAIARNLSDRHGLAYESSEVGVTSGAKQALFNAAMVLFDPGDEVVVPLPCWSTFAAQASLAGAMVIYAEGEAGDSGPAASAVVRAMTPRTRAVILNSPHNPTGSMYSDAELASIGEAALEHDLWVVFDECYADLVRAGHRHRNIVEIVPELKDRTVSVGSFSKSHAMTGWRVGYACAPARVIKAMGDLQGHTTSNASRIAQHAALGALLDGNRPFIESVNRELELRLAIVTESMSDLPGIAIGATRGAFYVFVDIRTLLPCRHEGRPVESSAELARALLESEQVAVVPGETFSAPDHLRISYAVSTEDLRIGLARFAKFVRRLEPVAERTTDTAEAIA